MMVNSGGWQSDLIMRHKAGICTYGLTLRESAEKIHVLLNNKKWIADTGVNALNLAKMKFDKVNLVDNLHLVLVEASLGRGKNAHNFSVDLE